MGTSNTGDPGASPNDSFSSVRRETSVRDLSFPLATLKLLNRLKIDTLEDLSKRSEVELRVSPDVSEASIRRMVELLETAGLKFSRPTDPALIQYELNHRIHTLPPEMRLRAPGGPRR